MWDTSTAPGARRLLGAAQAEARAWGQRGPKQDREGPRRRMEEEEGGTGWGWQGPEGELLRQSHS